MYLTHGLYHHPLYFCWANMVYRCRSPKHKSFKDYGGRGIRVCDEWQDVAAFISWIEHHLGPRPEGHSLDRIDNDGNYEPGNVRWATPSMQTRNQRQGNRPRGSANPQAKLTEDIVRDCRIRWAAGETTTALAAEFGVCHQLIYDVVVGKRWRHVA